MVNTILQKKKRKWCRGSHWFWHLQLWSVSSPVFKDGLEEVDHASRGEEGVMQRFARMTPSGRLPAHTVNQFTPTNRDVDEGCCEEKEGSDDGSVGIDWLGRLHQSL
jgi:hypothetical protein